MQIIIIKENVGMDISMDDFSVCFLTLSSNMSIVVKGTRTFPNNERGYISFVEWVKRKTSGICPFTFTMEATGVYYEGIAYHLFEEGFGVHVVLPNHAKKYGGSLGTKSKTDAIDARLLAQMGLERNLPLWKPSSPHFWVLKNLTRERQALIHDRTAALNRLHAYSHQGCPLQDCIERTNRQIAFYEDQITEIESQIKKIVDSDPALSQRISYIQSIKGVGFLTAVIIIAETNGFATFTGIKQVVSFAGLDIRIRESGKWKGKSRISKCGNRHIRKALYMPALAKISHDPNTRIFYERLVEKKRIKMVAGVAVQRKLLALIYTLWKKQEMFDPSAPKISGNVQHKSSFGSAGKAKNSGYLNSTHYTR